MAQLMKGHVWADRCDAKDRKGNPIVTYPLWVEPKVDEIRVHVIRVGGIVDFLSYAGKPLYNLKRFQTQFLAVMVNRGITEIDCGVEVDGIFNSTYRYVRSSRGIPKDLRTAAVRFHVYDIPEYSMLAYEFRKPLAQDVAHRLRLWGVVAGVLDHNIAHNAEDVQSIYEYLRSCKYEGAMVKNPRALYRRTRTDDWLKMKPHDSAEGTITKLVQAVCGVDQPDLELYKGDLLDRIGSVELTLADGSTATPHGIPHEIGKKMLANPDEYLGVTCEFQFMERDRQGGYRHPTFYRLREDVV